MSKNRNRKVSIRNSLIDICILTANVIDPAVFRKCIEAVNRESATNDCRVYIFRNGSIPETRQAYDEILDTVSNLHEKHSNDNVGFPAGANRAIRAGTSPLILFVSDDIILHEGTLNKLVRRMENTEIGMCGLKLTFPDDSTDSGRPAGKVQHIGHAIDIHGEVVHPLMGWSKENPKCNISREVISVTGAAFMVRRKAFLAAGGFFEGYGKGYFEDVDLNLTLRSLGWKIFIDAGATATHYVGATFIKKNEPVPMDNNRFLLRQRKGNQLAHTSWEFW